MALAFVVILFPIVLCGLASVAGIIAGIFDIVGIFELDNNSPLIVDIGLLIVRFILLGVSLWLLPRIWKGEVSFSKKLSANHQNRLVQFQSFDLPRWEYAINRWNQLYYCDRHDIIFVPQEGTSASRLQMMDYIYPTE